MAYDPNVATSSSRPPVSLQQRNAHAGVPVDPPHYSSYDLNGHPDPSHRDLARAEEYDLPPRPHHGYVDDDEDDDANHSLPLHSPSSYAMTPSASSNGRFAGGFDPYGRTAVQPGEDKVAEKKREKAAGKYANMIPVHKPPKTPMEHVARFMNNEYAMLAVYTGLSLFTRLWNIGRSPHVIWDEAHFGKFGSHYLKHEFYFDVHPPLGKMLVGLAGLLSGYHGDFEFKSGEEYPADVNYVGMRVILAMFGVGMVPVAWSTSGALGWNWRARHFVTSMVLFDNAWLVISRFILLDSMLLFFTFTSVHGLVKFHQQQDRSFSQPWWFWLSFTGASLGCVASVKWVGLFVTALIGIYTIEDLWQKFGDLTMPIRTYIRHWCARILCLMVIPLTIYMISFKLHFMILNHSGTGDAQMSSLFQAHLKGNDFANNPPEIAFGSRVTFKNMGYGGGLLHSHIQTYPVGSQQQQVTCYHYKDNNNEFDITPIWEEKFNVTDPAVPLRMLKSGDTIRIVHTQTGRNLHSHPVVAPITKENYEVSAYGDDAIGDSNDYWVVEVVDDTVLGKGKLHNQIRSLTTRMRIKHKNLNCYLRAANAVLPQWGWKQVEVSCDKENNPKDEHTYWNIESHWNDRMAPGDAKLYRSPFLRDFIHLNVAMMTSNNALIPDADKEDILASAPLDWPWLWNGLRMNGWDADSIKYYLIGNPFVWWTSTASLGVFAVVSFWYAARQQRKYNDLSPAAWEQFLHAGKIASLGWFLHYFPFLLMGRVTYIHHYLPTLYFAVLLLAHLVDHFVWNDLTARYRPRKLAGGYGAVGGKEKGGSTAVRVPVSETTKNAVFAVCMALTIGVFTWFSGASFGMDGDIANWKGMKWRNSWNIY